MTRILIALATLAALAATQGPAPDPAAFTRDLAKAAKLVESGRWAQARRQLDRTLKTHEGALYARARRAEIIELARVCDFRGAHPPPDPKQLVSGKLLSYSRSSGKMKLRYRPEEMGDWSRVSQMRVHPARFAGPYSIRIKGRSYPGGNGAMVFVGLVDEGGFAVVFGREQINVGSHGDWVPSQICRIHGDSLDERDSKEMSPCKVGKPYRILVKVTSSSILAAYNGRQIMSSGKPRGDWGHAGFLGGMKFDEIVIEGKAEPSWLQRLGNAVDEERRAEFTQRWRPRQNLPGWLFAKPAAPVASAAADAGAEDRKWPGEFTPKQETILEQAEFLLEMERFQAGLAYVRARSPDELPPAARHWFLARYHAALDSDEEALKACRETARLDATFMPAHLLELEILRRRDREAEAFALLEKLVERFPGSASLHSELAGEHLAAGRFEEAKRVVDRALGRGVTSKDIEAVNATLVKAIRGPTWSRHFAFRSEHYEVISDIDKRTCREAAQLLEESYLAYTNRLERVADAPRKLFAVYLFSGESGYQAYCQDLWGVAPTHTAGLYAPPLKQLLIWNLPDRASMMETVRHEGFHQYLDRLMRDPPLWFNEGLATYFQTARRAGARWHLGDPPRDYLAIVKRYPPKVRELVHLGREKFLQRAGVHYPQSWAVIHLLRHGERWHRTLFDELWAALKEGPTNKAALDRVLPPVKLTRLQADLDAHLASLN